ncbi:hypothetical protein F4806DRAFT_219703 [Annulohypoxylon nitens]|nr:hypothetical protein F4806DRAFT_219703 [Annulohypoxylon nitens]
MMSGGSSYLSSGTKSSNRKKDKSGDKSKHMYMERRKGSKAVVVYDPGHRSGRKGSSSSSSSQRQSGAAAPYQPNAMLPPPIPSANYSSQFGSGGSHFGEQVSVHSFSGPAGPTAGPQSPGPRYHYLSEEEELRRSTPYHPLFISPYTPSVASGSMASGSMASGSVASRISRGGSICPDESASQYSARSGRHSNSGHSGNAGRPRGSERPGLSWVGSDLSSKRILYDGGKPRGRH